MLDARGFKEPAALLTSATRRPPLHHRLAALVQFDAACRGVHCAPCASAVIAMRGLLIALDRT